MDDVLNIFVSRTNGPARSDAIHRFEILQGLFVSNQRCSVVSPLSNKNTSSLALNVVSGPGLQILAGNLYGKKIRSNKSVDRPFKNNLKSFLREVAVSPGNAFAPRNPVKVAYAEPSIVSASVHKKRYKRESIVGQYCVRVHQIINRETQMSFSNDAALSLSLVS